MVMEEEPPDHDLDIGATPEPAKELDPRAINAELREHEHLWTTKGDSEALWEEEHELLSGRLHQLQELLGEKQDMKGF